MASLWLTKRMSFWTKHRRHLQLLWIVIILSTLTENASSNGISAEVTITPSPARPNTWVKLECKFNLTASQTTLLYWGDRDGDTLYIYEQGKPLRYGPKYSSGQIRNIITEGGNHSMELYVTGCSKDPYKCDIWRDTNEKIEQGRLKIEHIPRPEITQDGQVVSAFDITINQTYKLGCKVDNATQKHNLTMKIEGLDPQTAPAPVDSTYNAGACLHSSTMEKEFMLTDVDDFRVTCEARFADGNQTGTIAASPSPCNSNPCQNAGTCLHYPNRFVCRCPDDYTGVHCETINPVCIEPPKTENVLVTLGDPVNLTCPIQASSYKWSSAEAQNLPAVRTLRFDVAYAANQSNYTCHADLSYCSKERLTIFELQVSHTWEVPVNGESIRRNKGDTLTLDCVPAGKPSPLVQWFYRHADFPANSTGTNNTPIANDTYTKVALGEPSQNAQTLTIHALTSANSGLYLCQASYLDVVEVIRNVNVFVTDMGASTQMDVPMWAIIVIAVVAGIIVIVIVTIIAVCAVKKKKVPTATLR